MTRLAPITFGIVCYAAFLLVLVHTVCFVGNFGPLPGIDAPGRGGHAAQAALVDLLLLTAFGLQHSVMARTGFKRRWQRLVPPSCERSVYVLCSAVALWVLYWQWRPIETIVWRLDHAVLRLGAEALFVCGWLLVVVATTLIHHGDLFGLSQTWARSRGRRYYPPRFVTPGPYRIVRHPLYLGWLLAFWATPQMTAGHLLFAGFFTLYVLVAIRLEERDLVRAFGWIYAEYRRHVPMLLPVRRRR